MIIRRSDARRQAEARIKRLKSDKTAKVPELIKSLRKVEQDKKSVEAQEAENRIADKKVEELDWVFARKLLRAQLLPLHGQKVNGYNIRVVQRPVCPDDYRITTARSDLFNQADWQAFEVAFGVRRYKFRGSDEVPEQDCQDNAIKIKWWRRGNSRNGDTEMGSGIEIDRFYKEKTAKAFVHEIEERLKYITRLNE